MTIDHHGSQIPDQVSAHRQAGWRNNPLPTPFEAFGQPGRFYFRPVDGITLGFTHLSDVTYRNRLGTGKDYDH